MIAARIYREQRNGGALRMWSGYCSKKMQMSSQTMSSWVSAGTTVEGWGVLSIPPLFQALSDPCLWGGSLQTSSVAQRWVSKPLKIKPPTPFLINFKSFCCTHQDHKAEVNFHPFVLNELFCSHAPEKKHVWYISNMKRWMRSLELWDVLIKSTASLMNIMLII